MKPHDKEQQTESGRKTYKQPRLEVYGDLREITRNVGKSGAKDGGTVQTTNTAS